MHLKKLKKLAIPPFPLSSLRNSTSINFFYLVFTFFLLNTTSLLCVQAQNHPNGLDFIGPDGLTYPDFTKAGIPGGIPNVQNIVATVERNSGDDRRAFMTAIQEAVNAGGGVVYVPNGTYNLYDHVPINHSNIVIRGESKEGVIINLHNNTTDDGAAFFFKGEFSYQSTSLRYDVEKGETRVYPQNIGLFQHTNYAFLRRERPPDFHSGMYGVRHGVFALQMIKITAKANEYLDFDMPAREDFKQSQGSKIYKLDAITRVGLENVTIYHPNEINSGKRSNGVSFFHAAEFWVKNCAFYDITNHYIDFHLVKNGEIRDCYFQGSPRRAQGGGNGYIGFWYANDCLMENVRSKNTRHIAFQIYASGNVIRKSHFEDAVDLNFHNLYPGHNLFEQNYMNDFTELSVRTGLSWGVYTTPTTSGQHSPVGSGNVVYNNYFETREFGGGLHLGGVEKDFKYVYNLMEFKGNGWYNKPYGNRLEPGIAFGNESRNTIVKGNVFSLPPDGIKDTWAVARMSTHNSSTYDEYIVEDNKFYGFRSDREVKESPSVFRNNEFLPETNNPPRPVPPVESIYEWQLDQIGGSTFPVELVDFGLNLEDIEIELKWETSQEINFSHFAIERSTDRNIFQKIATVDAVGATDGSSQYAYRDADLLRNQSYYYRLKMVDLDGSFEYSQVLEGRLENTSGFEMELYPNPAQEQLTVKLRLLEAMPFHIRMSDSRGQEVYFETFEAEEGLLLKELNIGYLSPGIYHLSVVGDYELLGRSFLKF